MSIARSIHLAVVAAVATAGLSASAAAAGPVPAQTTISAGKPRPVVVWDHAAWKKCWAITYAQWREDGGSVAGATAAADLTCGDPPL
jgi:hypothetical protein